MIGALMLPGAASAQIAWDGPALVSPASPSGLSIFLTDPHPSREIGVMGAWRRGGADANVGVRLGIAKDRRNDVAAAAGIDVSAVLAEGIEGSEIDVHWWTGVGAGVGRELLVSVPLGLVAGWTGDGGDAVLSPYAGGHVVLDVSSAAGDRFGLDASVDVGLDLRIKETDWVIRFGASFGGRDALGIGVRLPGPGAS